MSKKIIEYHLLADKTGTDNGLWQDVSMYRRISVHVKLTDTPNMVVRIMGSCTPDIPLSSSHEVQIGSDITSDTIMEITAKIKWIKAYIPSYTTGTCNVYLLGETTAYGI